MKGNKQRSSRRRNLKTMANHHGPVSAEHGTIKGGCVVAANLLNNFIFASMKQQQAVKPRLRASPRSKCRCWGQGAIISLFCQAMRRAALEARRMSQLVEECPKASIHKGAETGKIPCFSSIRFRGTRLDIAYFGVPAHAVDSFVMSDKQRIKQNGVRPVQKCVMDEIR